jgi:hypothetical protein
MISPCSIDKYRRKERFQVNIGTRRTESRPKRLNRGQKIHLTEMDQNHSRIHSGVKNSDLSSSHGRAGRHPRLTAIRRTSNSWPSTIGPTKSSRRSFLTLRIRS